ERLVDRYFWIPPMDVVQIDRVDAESAKTCFASLYDVLARESAHVRTIAHRIVDLRGKHHFLETRVLSQSAPGDLFAHALRIHVGRIEKIDARLYRLSKEWLCRFFIEHPRSPRGISVGHAAKCKSR